MPTYEYACNDCGHRFDIRQSFTDEPLRDCPQCGAHVHRVIYPAGVIFKGSGWYINDSRSGSKASHSDASKSSGESPSTKTTDSTPDTASGSAKSNGSTTETKSSSEANSSSDSKSKSDSKRESKPPVKSAADD